ncbi:MAG: thermonuclease family protein [Dehalococcoidia bacterium]|nr:thermonuclease family protein [Dehalococcoidia bacterium]
MRRIPACSRRLALIAALMVTACIGGYYVIAQYVPPALERDEALVARVIDGDTIELADGSRVRYLCVDTPERGEPLYAEATQRNSELVSGNVVRLETGVEEVDQYGRLLRYVYVGDVFVNATLVKDGLARTLIFDEEEIHAGSLRLLEAEAERAGRGLWALE